jgi:probable HAF family extracellular repeat protein
VIVGQASTAGGELHAVMWEDGVITDLGTLEGTYSVAYAVDRRGVACGLSTIANGETRAAVFRDGAVVNLGTLGGSSSQCFLGASRRGHFVGTSTIAGDAEAHAFIAVDDVMTDLNTLRPEGSGWLLEYAYGINDHEEVVGGGHRDGVAPIRAYLLSHRRPRD